MLRPGEIVVDNFAGGGGASTGISDAHPGCNAWASWGYGCTKEIGSGDWYCFAHRPSDEMPATKLPDAMPAGLPESGRQKRLL